MQVQYLSPLSDLKVEIKPLFSNEYMLAFFKKFCHAIKSRMWKFKKKKNARYDADDFLRVFFYSEITGRSIDSASERLNKYLLNRKYFQNILRFLKLLHLLIILLNPTRNLI